MGRMQPLLGLIASIFLISGFQVAYVIAGVNQSQIAALILGFLLKYAFVIWVVADARCLGRTPCYEFGFLVYLFFPISLIWYVFRSYGAWGLLVLPMFFGLMLLPSLAVLVTWNVLYGS